MIEYRKADLADFEKLLSARIDFLLDAGNIQTPDQSAQMRSANEEYIEEGMGNDSLLYFLALNGDEIIGTCSISFFRLPPNRHNPMGKTGYIGNVYTRSDFRRQGIASELLDLTVKEAMSRGCGKIMLNATQMGRGLYEKYGFVDDEDGMLYFIQRDN